MTSLTQNFITDLKSPVAFNFVWVLKSRQGLMHFVWTKAHDSVPVDHSVSNYMTLFEERSA